MNEEPRGMLRTLSMLRQQADMPSPEELAAQQRAALLRRLSRVTKYNAKVFDMSRPGDAAEYEELMLKFMGMPSPELVRPGQEFVDVKYADRRFSDSGAERPGWHIYVEWCDGVIEEQPVA